MKISKKILSFQTNNSIMVTTKFNRIHTKLSRAPQYQQEWDLFAPSSFVESHILVLY